MELTHLLIPALNCTSCMQGRIITSQEKKTSNYGSHHWSSSLENFTKHNSLHSSQNSHKAYGPGLHWSQTFTSPLQSPIMKMNLKILVPTIWESSLNIPMTTTLSTRHPSLPSQLWTVFHKLEVFSLFSASLSCSYSSTISLPSRNLCRKSIRSSSLTTMREKTSGLLSSRIRSWTQTWSMVRLSKNL